MKEFVEYLVRSIVSNKDNVVVEETKDGDGLDVSIKVDTADMGTIIGKGGKTIRSIRALAKAKAIKDGVRVRVEILEAHPKDSL
ncbi:KH domain-containing protein [candidate division WWE3 bacterium]|nr:KH domain-containing protein [candidate division WWE3 bacterium]